jgi:hypothetical protein
VCVRVLVFDRPGVVDAPCQNVFEMKKKKKKKKKKRKMKKERGYTCG